jgi:hypothetical protein
MGQPSADDVWKTSYEVQNEMRSFQRSAYPPGYAGHEPGAREKFGFSTPGPHAHKLTKPDLCLREDVDIDEPRRIHAVPRHQVTDERVTFRNLDVPEMDKSYKSGIMSPMYRSMAKTRSMPTLERKAAPARLAPLPQPVTSLEDEHFSYFVPKGFQRENPEMLMSRSLSKLYKMPEKKVMLPFSGDGTGFKASCSGTEWWPSASRLHEEPTAYQSAFNKKPPIHRMSPFYTASE